MKHFLSLAVRLPAAAILAAVVILGFFATGTEAKDELTVYAGAVVSNNPIYDSLVMIEFPFSISRHEFSFFMPDSAEGGLYARVFAQVDLLDTAGFALDSVGTYFSLRVGLPQEASLMDYRVFNKLALLAPPGLYSARLTVIDVVSKKRGESFLERIEAEPAHNKRITISRACLAYDLRYVGENDSIYNPRLRKNGFHVVVNPVSVFSDSDTILFLYGEIYNLKYSSSDASAYQLAVAILDHAGDVYQNLGSRMARKPGESVVIAESLDLREIATGAYRVQIVTTDLETGQADTALLPFAIVSPETIAQVTSAETIVYDDADLSVQDHANMVRHLLVPEQLQILSALSDSGKVNYLTQYWREHDVDPTTLVVENRRDMIARYRFSNNFFSTNRQQTNGWSTDRGRIYMTYGRWDERDDINSPRIGNPYEVWHYRSINEGKVFVFEDWSGSGEYRLVHSNVYGEVYSKDWQERIDQGFIDVPD